MSDQWTRVNEIKGGLVVFCTLCGRRNAKRFFMAKDTNYAEARRLAVAFEASHRHSEMHEAALAAFHSDDVPAPSEQEKLLREIFGGPPPTMRELRRRAAADAATTVKRGVQVADE